MWKRKAKKRFYFNWSCQAYLLCSNPCVLQDTIWAQILHWWISWIRQCICKHAGKEQYSKLFNEPRLLLGSLTRDSIFRFQIFLSGRTYIYLFQYPTGFLLSKRPHILFPLLSSNLSRDFPPSRKENQAPFNRSLLGSCLWTYSNCIL